MKRGVSEGEAVTLVPATRLRRYVRAIVIGVTVALVFCIGCGQKGDAHAPATDPAVLEQQAHDKPDDFLAQLRWGEALVQAKQLEEATSVLSHARQLAPNDARPYAWLGVVAISERRPPEEVRGLLQEALQRDPENLTALRAQANLDAQERRLHPAIQGFEHLVRLRPNDADAWQRLGLLLMGARENYRSLDALSHAAALDPSDMLTQRSLGMMALHAGRIDQAQRAFQAVLAHDPNDAQALTGLAGVLMRLDPSPVGLAAAEQQADAALRAEPTAIAYRTRGQIRMNRRQFSGAIEDLNHAISLEPKNRDSYVLLSQCYASAGKPELARKASAEFDRLTAEQLARDKATGRPPETMK